MRTHTARTPNSTPGNSSAFRLSASVAMLLLGIASLTGCAGISAGAGSNQQQQPGSLSLGSASVNFGSITAGTSKTLSLTATNLGSQSVTINSASTSNNSFSLMSPSVPSTVAAGASTTFSLKFAPGAAGTFNGTLTIASNASNASVSVPLSGTAVANGQLAANPSTAAFGNVLVGNQQTISETLTNTGVSSVTISQASPSGSGFSLSGITTPLTLSGGQSTSFTVTFSPQATGAATGSVTITSDATNPTLSIPLSGTGIAAGQLSASPSTAAFGNVTIGNQLSVSETVTNTGGTSVSISNVAISGTGFSLNGIAAPVTLAAGQSTSFTIVFVPQSSGAASGNVTLTSNAANPTLAIPLTGSGITPGQLTNNPATAAFGSVNVGNQQSLTETVTNTGGTSVTISQIGITGTGFSLSGISAPKTLAAGQSTTLTVTFAPQAAGTASGSVTVSSNAPNPTLTIPLSGTGTSPQSTQLSVSPATLALGSVTVGSSGNGSGTLTATGGSVTVTAASTNNSAFTVGGLSLPVTISAGQSVPFTITFSPQATGSASATLTVTSNAQPSTTTEALTGTGTAPASHSVNLSWTASTSSDVAGYNIYRAPYSGSCGSFSKINSVLNTSTVYTDSTVANSTSYCYATTAVDTSNDESSYSNIVSNIAIP
ncbi:MAG TPA: choice-of-anchor D domain-containing protein [Terriglobales bacterium]|nr:choice-of-anchor D domain-containing protein [Terriglobales bacterium]